MVKDPTRLIAFLAEQCKEYKNLLLDYPESGSLAEDYKAFFDEKAELLDNAWNAIYRHFTGESNGGFLQGPDGI